MCVYVWVWANVRVRKRASVHRKPSLCGCETESMYSFLAITSVHVSSTRAVYNHDKIPQILCTAKSAVILFVLCEMYRYVDKACDINRKQTP